MINKITDSINRCLPLTWDESVSYIEAMAKMLAKINEIILAMGTTSAQVSDIQLIINVIKGESGGDLADYSPAIQALELAVAGLDSAIDEIESTLSSIQTVDLAGILETIATIKGTGWTNENLAGLQDQITTINSTLEGVDDAIDYILNGGT